ncbi:sensor histidine kinase [Paucibacter sp. R3-3]|uniref:histidine kinase n=1 Tax=Roseateles agri TaxID=3098619 RepID=A0ABU5DKS0_9BURK|nr:sensor histidine kinase [Paucibacter sp. R3-3]MDY0746905.1 sensor histidine kinase [Paucibacter sp. R3-3]
MRLAQFIESNMEAILAEWEAFARTLLPASDGLDMTALRDHAEQILLATVRDLGSAQTENEQASKSRGEALRPAQAPETAAETHGFLRATGGFTLKQLVAEYRALRATVLKLWTAQHEPGPDTLADMTRFNEAIDQAVSESVDIFALETERWRNVFLGVLGHDLRGPLNAILLTSQLLSRLNDVTPVSKLAARLINGGERMRHLLDDLLDYSRASLDIGIRVTPSSVQLAEAFEEEIELQRAIRPDNLIEFVAEGGTVGVWDATRLRQALGNLVSNAAKYGDGGTPIKVHLIGYSYEATFTVENTGPSISASEVKSLFDPLRRAAHGDDETERTSLGLGLFIVRHIVRAHGGTVTLFSRDGKTVFSASLPKVPAASA